MEDTGRLKLIIVGLLLAAIAGGYLFFSGKIANKTVTGNQTAGNKTTLVKQISPSPTPILIILSPNPTPATLGVTTTTKGGQPVDSSIKTLPSTGAPLGLIAIASATASMAGWFLRKFPN